MGLHFSEEAEQLNDLAVKAQEPFFHHYISCEHFFLACLEVCGSCRGFLSRLDFTKDRFEEELLLLTPKGDAEPLWEGIVRTPRVRKHLKQLAPELAERHQAHRVEPRHLLASMVRDENSIPARILREHCTQVDEAVEELLEGKIAEVSSDSGQEFSKENSSKTKASSGKFLEEYTRDLVALAKEGKFDPVIGRAEEVDRVALILARKTKSNPILLGEAGVGKTAVALGLAQKIAAGTVPRHLKEKRILEMSPSSLVAGAKYRGEFEERLEKLIEEASEDDSVILFVDEIHAFIGSSERSGPDVSNILKPAMARGDISLFGATTIDEYRKFIEKDPALERRFQPVRVEEPSESDAVAILRGLKKTYEEHHSVIFEDEALTAAVNLSVRFLPDRNLPDKALDLLDEAAARTTMKSLVLTNPDSDAPSGPTVVQAEDVAEIVAEWTGIPVQRMSQDESKRLMQMEQLLQGRVIGQDHAVHSVAETIRVVRMGLASAKRPSGVFFFCGPSGVGKTELAKALSDFLFGSEDDLIRLDMSEYQEKHSVSRLIGSPPGYVGHEEEGQLTGAVRTKPYSVVLLDEVEKAHPEVFDLFLQVFDDGRLTDSRGRVVNFTNTIIILTSNLGARSAIEQGYDQGVSGQLSDLPGPYSSALKQHFRPEFINRIDELVIFKALNRNDLVQIADIQLGKLKRSLEEQRNIRLTFDDEAIALILDHGYQPEYGARPLARAIQMLVSRPLSSAMLENEWQENVDILVTRGGDKLLFRGLPRSFENAEQATMIGGGEE